MAPEHELSPRAYARMSSLLPSLLGEVRARRRRRQVRRGIVGLCLLLLPLLLWRPWQVAVPAHRTPTEVAGTNWQLLPTDASVLARCEVPTQERREWFVGDDELRAVLRAAQRPDGLVRSGARVFVHSAAIDPWPAVEP